MCCAVCQSLCERHFIGMDDAATVVSPIDGFESGIERRNPIQSTTQYVTTVPPGRNSRYTANLRHIMYAPECCCYPFRGLNRKSGVEIRFGPCKTAESKASPTDEITKTLIFHRSDRLCAVIVFRNCCHRGLNQESGAEVRFDSRAIRCSRLHV